MLLSLCSHCSDCLLGSNSAATAAVQRGNRAQKRAHFGFIFSSLNLSSAPSKQHLLLRRRSFRFLLPLLFLLALEPRTIHSQQQQPSNSTVYTPRHSAGSAIASRILYVIAGQTSVTGVQSTLDVLSLPLKYSFSTETAPWTHLKPGIYDADAILVASPDETHLVLAGMGDPGSPLVRVYDIKNDTWLNQPGSSTTTLQTTPRIAVGMATDTFTGVILTFGGFYTTTGNVAFELDLIQASAQDVDQWAWLAPSYLTQLPPLYQPVMMYLPQLRATLIMGGCLSYTTTAGVSNCQAFTTAYLIRTAVSGGGNSNFTTTKQALQGPGPVPRLAPCYAVLGNGDVFMYGGAVTENALADMWLLSTKNWSWSLLSVANAPIQGRAGATCQSITPNQVIVVGGYDGPNTGTNRNFSFPQVAIVNTQKRVWTSDYDSTDGTVALSLAAIGGISAASALVFCLMVFVIGRFIWKKRGRHQKKHQKRESQSSEPLMEDGPLSDSERGNSTQLLLPSTSVSLATTNQSVGSFDSSTRVGSVRDREGDGGSRVLSKTRFRDSRSSLPLIITPISPTGSMSSGSTTVITAGATVIGGSGTSNSPIRASRLNNNNSPVRTNHGISTAEVDFPESERLSQTMADIQHGYYIRTLQHNKQYEKRRSVLQMQRQQYHQQQRERGQQQERRMHRPTPIETQSRLLSGVDTTSLNHGPWNHRTADLDMQDRPYLASALLNLKDVEFDEDPVAMIPMEHLGLGTGSMLVSTHLDTFDVTSASGTGSTATNLGTAVGVGAGTGAGARAGMVAARSLSASTNVTNPTNNSRQQRQQEQYQQQQQQQQQHEQYQQQQQQQQHEQEQRQQRQRLDQPNNIVPMNMELESDIDGGDVDRDEDEHDDKFQYIPGIGGSITVAEKRIVRGGNSRTVSQVSTGTTNLERRQRLSIRPQKSELISTESVDSEVLIDNRRSRQGR